MSTDDPADPSAWRPVIARGRWFAALPADAADALLRAGRVRRVPAASTLFRRGDPNEGLFCVLEGSVRIGAASAAGGREGEAREQLLSVLEAPQWFGEIACLDGGPRTHDAATRGPATLLQVPRAEVERLAREDPRWWRLLGQLLAEKVRALFVGLEDLGPMPASLRVARRLLAMATGHGMLAPGLSQRVVPVSQEQLGAMLGLTRQTVSEVLRDFEARGVVRRGYGEVEVLDEAALAREAAGVGR